MTAMTDEQIDKMIREFRREGTDSVAMFNFARAIERAVREAAIEECAKACTKVTGGLICAGRIRALREGKS